MFSPPDDGLDLPAVVARHHFEKRLMLLSRSVAATKYIPSDNCIRSDGVEPQMIAALEEIGFFFFFYYMEVLMAVIAFLMVRSKMLYEDSRWDAGCLRTSGLFLEARKRRFLSAKQRLW